MCPEKLLVHQQVMSALEPGLRAASTRREHIFDGVVVTSGPPEYGVQEVVEQQSVGGKLETIWLVDADTWFSCTYRGTSAQLQGQIDPKFKECRLVEDKTAFTETFLCTQ